MPLGLAAAAAAAAPPTPFPLILSSFSPKCYSANSIITSSLPPNPKPAALPNIILSIAVAVTTFTTSPLSSLAIPSLNSTPPPSSLSPTTPFSQSKNLATGLLDGTIRACPSSNPSCISTNPKSSSSVFPWVISKKSAESPAQELFEAILETQKNVKIDEVENTPNGQYLRAEVDGGFGRDVLEFLVKGDVVAYRAMAKKVTYLYPLTTALGDSKGQEERMKKIVDQLGWYAPSLDSME